MKFPVFIAALAALFFLSAWGHGSISEIQVPAYTAYFEPDMSPKGVKISPDTGITGWSRPDDRVVWYGYLSNTGTLNVSVKLALPRDAQSSLRILIAEQDGVATPDDADIDGNDGGAKLDADATGEGNNPVTVNFGKIRIKEPGVYRFVLAGTSKTGPVFGDLKALVLGGPAAVDAHFSMDKSRVAPSVHFWYSAPGKTKVSWFYNEVTVRAEPLYSYYMVCGFTGGYFGIQVNGTNKRTILFSVWNSDSEKIDAKKVPEENKVTLVSNGDGVESREFGHEGTGGHSGLDYMWKTGQTYRFLVSALPDGSNTIYSGYFFFPEKDAWGLIASWKKPKDGGWLRGLYSFNEDYVQPNGFEKRYAEFGNQWIVTEGGDWIEITNVSFTHTHRTGDREDFGAGVTNNRFFLSNGGFVPFHGVKYGDRFYRSPSGKVPVDELPVLLVTKKR